MNSPAEQSPQITAVVTDAGACPVLVTGATGRIGREVIAQLLGAGVPVRALTRRAPTAGLPAAVEVMTGDFTVPESIATSRPLWRGLCTKRGMSDVSTCSPARSH